MGEVELLTRAEVARMLRVSTPTLSRWAAAGEGPPVVWLAGRVPRYDRAAVVAWLAARAG